MVASLFMPAAVIAGMSLDLDRDRHVEAGNDRMLSARIEHSANGFHWYRPEGDAALR